jgi:N-acetylglucosaminyldiphosphoundecaprenol N-acetyl-beta-D-mannosaminyltransferase
MPLAVAPIWGQTTGKLAYRPEPSVDLLGVSLHPLTTDGALTVIERFIREGQPRQVVTVNLDFLRLARSSTEFRDVLNSADLALPDGMPLVWASKIARKGVPCRVAGIDLVEGICAAGAQRGHSVFLLGARHGVALNASVEIMRRYPGIRIAGTYSPPVGVWSDLEEHRIRDMIIDAAPDVLLVALGAPRQDAGIAANRDALGVPASIGVGCSCDVISGKASRAPRIMRNLGFEWLYRLVHDPRRLWRRYVLHDMPAFVRLMLGAFSTRARSLGGAR